MTGRASRPRAYIPFPERLASALSLLLTQQQCDDLRARRAPAHSVIALFQFDHNILHAHDGSDAWWNLTPMLVGEHRIKAARDTSIVAKVDRLSREQCEYLQVLLAKRGGETATERKRGKRSIPSRPFAKVRRPIRAARGELDG